MIINQRCCCSINQSHLSIINIFFVDIAKFWIAFIVVEPVNVIYIFNVTYVNYQIFIILKESFESDITYINYQIFTKSEREWAYDMLHMLDKLQLKEVAMFRGSYI